MQKRRYFNTESGVFSSLLGITFLICLLWITSFLSGCALLEYGTADVTPFSIEEPSGLVGLKKSQVINRLGLSQGRIVDEQGMSILRY